MKVNIIIHILVMKKLRLRKEMKCDYEQTDLLLLISNLACPD